MAKFKGNPREIAKAKAAEAAAAAQAADEESKVPEKQDPEQLPIVEKNVSPAAERCPEPVEGVCSKQSGNVVPPVEATPVSRGAQRAELAEDESIAQTRAKAHEGVSSGNPRANRKSAEDLGLEVLGNGNPIAEVCSKQLGMNDIDNDVPLVSSELLRQAQGDAQRADARELPASTVGQIQVDAERIKAQAERAAAARENLNAKDVKKSYQQKKEDKAREREERKAARVGKKANKLKIFLIILAVLVVAGGAAGFYLATSDVLEIKKVEYVGADHLTQSECEALTTMSNTPNPVGQNLLTFNGDAIASNFKNDAWVQNVTFNRVFPDTLQVVVEEKQIAAFVDFARGASQVEQSWVLAADGTWIMGVPTQDSETGKQLSQKIYEDSESTLHIKDCPNGIEPVIGATCTDETVLNALSIVNGFTTDLKNQVKTITASSVNATTLVLTNNIEIAFGEATDIRDKERIAKEIMEQNEKVVYINVRSVDRPTWRSAS